MCPGIYLSPDVFAQVQRGLLNVMRAYLERPACYELCCAGHVHLLMYRLLAAAPHVLLTAEENAERERRNARLLRLIRFVDQNYMHKIRLSDFARAERRSISYLSHFVKEALGQSFSGVCEYGTLSLRVQAHRRGTAANAGCMRSVRFFRLQVFFSGVSKAAGYDAGGVQPPAPEPGAG